MINLSRIKGFIAILGMLVLFIPAYSHAGNCEAALDQLISCLQEEGTTVDECLDSLDQNEARAILIYIGNSGQSSKSPILSEIEKILKSRKDIISAVDDHNAAVQCLATDIVSEIDNLEKGVADLEAALESANGHLSLGEGNGSASGGSSSSGGSAVNIPKGSIVYETKILFPEGADVFNAENPGLTESEFEAEGTKDSFRAMDSQYWDKIKAIVEAFMKDYEIPKKLVIQANGDGFCKMLDKKTTKLAGGTNSVLQKQVGFPPTDIWGMLVMEDIRSLTDAVYLDEIHDLKSMGGSVFSGGNYFDNAKRFVDVKVVIKGEDEIKTGKQVDEALARQGAKPVAENVSGGSFEFFFKSGTTARDSSFDENITRLAAAIEAAYQATGNVVKLKVSGFGDKGSKSGNLSAANNRFKHVINALKGKVDSSKFKTVPSSKLRERHCTFSSEPDADGSKGLRKIEISM